MYVYQTAVFKECGKWYAQCITLPDEAFVAGSTWKSKAEADSCAANYATRAAKGDYDAKASRILAEWSEV